jgi:EAL domain-containing protein (putative c-di-GMP-specific phosphodiesterase class I)
MNSVTVCVEGLTKTDFLGNLALEVLSLTGDTIKMIVKQKRFYPVFQPIVRFVDGDIVGFEALTRFTDGYNPVDIFHTAARSGSLADLEIETMTKAIDSIHNLLLPGQFLAVNVSPPLLVDRLPAVSEALAGISGQVIVELTEHIKITNYESVRQATKMLGVGLKVAIDDVGSDYSNLKKIVELHPDYLKLDICLIHNIDSDPYRLALIRSLQSFAETVGCTLIAEGVETEEERRTLQDIGVSMGQGFLLGRPTPLSDAGTLDAFLN